MGTVDVSVGHDDDAVVAQLFDVEVLAPDRSAERHDQITDLLGTEHAIETGALDVEDLAAERQDGLVVSIAPLGGGATGGVALDEEQFGFGRVLLGAILELAGKEVHVERRFAARQLARLAGSLAGRRGFGDLGDDGLGLRRVLLKPLAQPFVDAVLDDRPHFG